MGPPGDGEIVSLAHMRQYLCLQGKGYFYDQDPLRVPSVRPWARGSQKPGLMRREEDAGRTSHLQSAGTKRGSVWQSSEAITRAITLRHSLQNLS